MRRAWSAAVFALGFLALVAQTLLFRAFFTVFEGNELGIGVFFATWLLWVAGGALIGRAVARRAPPRPSRFAWLALLYLPAFLLQHELILHARAIAGVAAWELFPLGRMVAAALLCNAPVSLATGLLFTLACRCAAVTEGLPVARVYALESLGGFAGGALVTLLLAGGVAEESAFCWTVLPFGAALIPLLRQERILGLTGAAVVLLALAAPIVGLDSAWATRNRRLVWERLLPAGSFRGSFATAQGRYLYGERADQFAVMSWGGVSETLPDREHAAETVAVALAQHPEARRVLVVGPGSLPLALAWAGLPGSERVVWLHPDPDYPGALLPHLPEALREACTALEVPAEDVRRHLARDGPAYDLVQLNLPDVTTLLRNRYATMEFFRLVRARLAPGGVVALRITGGENVVGSELAHLGASAWETLAACFERVVLEPGEESWLLASDGAALSEAPAELRARFEAVPGAAALFPPDGLLSLYRPDRIAMQKEAYGRARAVAGAEFLRNTDDQPKALLFSLAVELRRAGRRDVAGDLAALASRGVAIGVAAVCIALALRIGWILLSPRPPPQAPGGLFDAGVLILALGAIAMSVSILLLHGYQARFGSLYLHAGLAFALFMLGLFLGALLVERRIVRAGAEKRGLLPLCLLALLVFLGLLALLPGRTPQAAHVALFLLGGLVCGLPFPVAAERWRRAGRTDAQAGAALETLDHLGGVLGAWLVGVVTLPLLGAHATLLLLALLAGAQLVPPLFGVRARLRTPAPDPLAARARAAAYVGFGAATVLLAASALLAQARAGREEERLAAAALEMAGDAELVPRRAATGDGEEVGYLEVRGDAGRIEGFVFPTSRLAPRVFGYNGPIHLAVHVDRDGRLLGHRVLRSRETPAYLERLRPWRASLRGRDLFGPRPFTEADTVSGATLSARGLTATLEVAGRRFAAEVLGRKAVAAPPGPAAGGPDRNFVVLALLLAGALAARLRPAPWTRRLFLALVAITAGFWLNLQFSSHQVFTLLRLEWPVPAWSASFLLLAVLPLLVLLFGNFYCGYVCPFGALQELIGEFRPRTLPLDPSPAVWRHARAVKYALLGLLAFGFALTRDAGVLAADPLITFFGAARESGAFALGLATLACALFFRRFWCRNLCPAGAFLALLNRVRLLRRWLPATRPARCDLGVRTPHDLDCLLCDRCRHAQP